MSRSLILPFFSYKGRKEPNLITRDNKGKDEWKPKRNHRKLRKITSHVFTLGFPVFALTYHCFRLLSHSFLEFQTHPLNIMKALVGGSYSNKKGGRVLTSISHIPGYCNPLGFSWCRRQDLCDLGRRFEQGCERG